MRGTITKILSLTLLLAAAGPLAAPAAEQLAGQGAAQVGVTYVAPETFRDREFRQASSRASALAEFDRWFAEFGARYLPPGAQLRIEVLDIDLAGDFEPWRTGWQDVRFLRDTTPPRIHLRWQLEQGGKLVRRGDARLSDMNYLWDPRGRGDERRFAHDRLLVQDWFRKTFAPGAAG